jgi:hypothetical protein
MRAYLRNRVQNEKKQQNDMVDEVEEIEAGKRKATRTKGGKGKKV